MAQQFIVYSYNFTILSKTFSYNFITVYIEIMDFHLLFEIKKKKKQLSHNIEYYSTFPVATFMKAYFTGASCFINGPKKKMLIINTYEV